MGVGVTQQGPHRRHSVGSAAQASADNDLLHVCHYDLPIKVGIGPRSERRAEPNLSQALHRSLETTSPGC